MIIHITITHKAIAALLTYHQLASPQAHSAPLNMSFLVRAGLCKSSYSHTHTHTICYGQDEKGLPPALDNLHLGCSYHLHSSHCFLSTWGVVMLEKKLQCQVRKKKFER